MFDTVSQGAALNELKAATHEGAHPTGTGLSKEDSRIMRQGLIGRMFVCSCLLALVGSAQADTVTAPIRQFGLGTLECVAYSPDGDKILTGGGGGAYLWDVSTGTVLRKFSGHTCGVNSVAFSPDGTKVLTGSYDDTAKLLDANTAGCAGQACFSLLCGRV